MKASSQIVLNPCEEINVDIQIEDKKEELKILNIDKLNNLDEISKEKNHVRYSL